MKQKRYWLWSGTIFLSIYVVIVINAIPENFVVNKDEFLLGLAILQYPITTIESIFNYGGNNIASLIIGGVITWSILGVIIGLIYGKIKRWIHDKIKK